MANAVPMGQATVADQHIPGPHLEPLERLAFFH
jgi:hypothetical protein